MSNAKKEIQDCLMTELMVAECPMVLGIPAWFIREITQREELPVPALEILGKRGEVPDNSLVACCLDVVGYEFSWGTVFERTYGEGDPEIEWEGASYLDFGIFPHDLLRRHPYFETVGDFFRMTMERDPNLPTACEVSSSECDWAVLTFTAYTEEDGASLRLWMAETFIPIILPNLIEEADRIMNLIAAGKMAADPMADYLYNKWEGSRKRAAEDEMRLRDESNVTFH